MPVILEQFRISDFLGWHRDKALVLDPVFQRGNVWTPAAKSYLIDTILRELPMPKVYLRTRVDLRTHTSIREVVDGQQRLRAIIEFAGDQFALNERSKEFAGYRYSDFSDEYQEIFLSYPISVDQLLNASDQDVIEVFTRLNTYTVPLSPPELRHAKYQGEFKWAVYEAAAKWSRFLSEFDIVSVRDQVRMEHHSLMAEFFGMFLDGLSAGGEKNIEKIYSQYDAHPLVSVKASESVHKVLQFFQSSLAEDLRGTRIVRRPHFLMLFGAVAHAISGIPSSTQNDLLPERNPKALSELDIVRVNLHRLSDVIGSEDPVNGFEDFWKASRGATSNLKSRRIRFPVYYRALLPNLI